METRDIIILDHTSLIKNAKTKIFTDITLYDFKSQALSREDICKASFIIFHNWKDIKYLKNN